MERIVRDKISRILIKWGMPTRQAAISEIMRLFDAEVRDVREYFAMCRCGDALERKNLYPEKATYRCEGCDKTFKLVEVKTDENNG